MDKHIDTNSILHFCVCFTPSALGGVPGAIYATYRGVKKEREDAHWCPWDMAFDLLGVTLGLLTHVSALYGLMSLWN